MASGTTKNVTKQDGRVHTEQVNRLQGHFTGQFWGLHQLLEPRQPAPNQRGIQAGSVPAWRISQTGGRGVSSPARTRRSKSFLAVMVKATTRWGFGSLSKLQKHVKTQWRVLNNASSRKVKGMHCHIAHPLGFGVTFPQVAKNSGHFSGRDNCAPHGHILWPQRGAPSTHWPPQMGRGWEGGEKSIPC